MQRQIDNLSLQVANLARLQESNHQQNRKDIHDLRDGQQQYINALYLEFKNLGQLLEKSLSPIRADVLELQLWKSKTTGYVVGITALAALIFRVVEIGLAKIGPH